jgi:uncharacterized RDD family membrane protein YckC
MYNHPEPWEGVMAWSDEVRIETPEQIDVGLELAGLGTRFVAQLLDWIIKVIVTAVLAVVGVLAAGLLGFGQQLEHIPWVVAAVLVGAAYLLWLGYDLFYEAVRNGQTPGKRYANIRVIRDGGAPVDFQAAAVRNLLGLADLLPGLYILGAVLVLLTPKRQRLGDLAAGTIVIRERVAAAPTETDAVVADLASPDYAFTARHLAACGPNERHVLRSFLRRLDTMDEAATDRLASRLAATFVEKMSYQPPRPLHDGYEATVFLASLYRDLQEHDRRG